MSFGTPLFSVLFLGADPIPYVQTAILNLPIPTLKSTIVLPDEVLQKLFFGRGVVNRLPHRTRFSATHRIHY